MFKQRFVLLSTGSSCAKWDLNNNRECVEKQQIFKQVKDSRDSKIIRTTWNLFF